MVHFQLFSGDTVLDESNNGNYALMLSGAYAVPKGTVQLEDTGYLDVPASVISGLDDFTIFMRVNIGENHFHTNLSYSAA